MLKELLEELVEAADILANKAGSALYVFKGDRASPYLQVDLQTAMDALAAARANVIDVSARIDAEIASPTPTPPATPSPE